MDILSLSKEKLLTLDPKKIDRALSPEEVVYIAELLGAFWKYDYETARSGKIGLHAELKSGKHSDGFFISKILLEPRNIQLLFALQIVRKIKQVISFTPDYVGGVPDGATSLGEDIQLFLGAAPLLMKKESGRILVTGNIKPGSKVLLIEDFCTTGTGFKEAASAVLQTQPKAIIIPYNPVIINRGGITNFFVERDQSIKIIPVAEVRINDWEKDDCPLCQNGSGAIKPKVSEESWLQITTSQISK